MLTKTRSKSFFIHSKNTKALAKLPWYVFSVCFVLVCLSSEAVSYFVYALFIAYAACLIAFPLVLKSYNIIDSSKLLLFTEVVFYSLLLYQYGGASNAAVSILYLPIVIAAVSQSKCFSWSILIFTLASYSLLMVLYSPDMSSHSHHVGHNVTSDNMQFNQHVLGMWFTFIFAACLMTWFITMQREGLLKQEKLISELKEKQLRDEQILAVATTAANAAHSLATPLSTLNMLSDELLQSIDEAELNQADKAEFDDLQQEIQVQIVRCEKVVKHIAQQARDNQPDKTDWQEAKSYILDVFDNWWVTHNEIIRDIQFEDFDNVLIETNVNLTMSIINVLENAAKASLSHHANKVTIRTQLQQNKLYINVQDYGQGIDTNILHKLGKTAVGTNAHGMGMGLVLANTTLERLQGQIILTNNTMGALTQIVLPIKKRHV